MSIVQLHCAIDSNDYVGSTQVHHHQAYDGVDVGVGDDEENGLHQLLPQDVHDDCWIIDELIVDDLDDDDDGVVVDYEDEGSIHY